MELKLLNKRELKELYTNEMTADFPKSELKPLRAMLRLMDMGCYDPLLVVEEGEPVGYAMLWLALGRQGALLEYLGVLRGKRNGGLGTRILALLFDRYGQLFGEAEAPDSTDAGENDLRCRRIGFYERNGFFLNPYPYLQPPISKGRSAIPLQIMTSGAAVSQEEFQRIKALLYRRVYRQG